MGQKQGWWHLPSLRDMWQGLCYQVWPARCRLCNKVLLTTDNDYVCVHCLNELPCTGFEKIRQNVVECRFYGRIKLHSAFSAYYFRKGEKLQKLIHAFKYNGRQDVAIALGRRIGHMMLLSNFHKDYDCLVPVPLHPSKLKSRGYNQSACVARGIAEITGLELREDILLRVVGGLSQTKKGVTDRWVGVKNSFDVNPLSTERGLRVIIVDDVLTTGATIEACCKAMYKLDDVRLGVVTVGVAV